MARSKEIRLRCKSFDMSYLQRLKESGQTGVVSAKALWRILRRLIEFVLTLNPADSGNCTRLDPSEDNPGDMPQRRKMAPPEQFV